MHLPSRLAHSLALVLVLAPLALACGARNAPMAAAPSAPSAIGSIHAGRGKGQGTSLAVEVNHLTAPEKVVPNARIYVVWAREESGGKHHKLGALRVDEDRKGKLEATTSLDRFEVTVTPEASAEASEPTNPPVLSGRITR